MKTPMEIFVLASFVWGIFRVVLGTLAIGALEYPVKKETTLAAHVRFVIVALAWTTWAGVVYFFS